MQLVSLKEVARRLSVSTSTARRMILRHKVRGWRIEGQWRIDAASVDEYLEMNAFVDFDELQEQEKQSRMQKGD